MLIIHLKILFEPYIQNDSKDNNELNLEKKEDKQEIQNNDDIQMKDKEKGDELNIYL